MKKKIIGIKNLKYCEWMSEETNCFTATVTVNDEDFCHAQDEGKGGMTYFYPLEDRKDYDPIDELEVSAERIYDTSNSGWFGVGNGSAALKTYRTDEGQFPALNLSWFAGINAAGAFTTACLLYTSPSPRD